MLSRPHAAAFRTALQQAREQKLHTQIYSNLEPKLLQKNPYIFLVPSQSPKNFPHPRRPKCFFWKSRYVIIFPLKPSR